MCACVSVFVCARLKSLTLPFRLCSDREEGEKKKKTCFQVVRREKRNIHKFHLPALPSSPSAARADHREAKFARALSLGTSNSVEVSKLN